MVIIVGTVTVAFIFLALAVFSWFRLIGYRDQDIESGENLDRIIWSIVGLVFGFIISYAVLFIPRALDSQTGTFLYIILFMLLMILSWLNILFAVIFIEKSWLVFLAGAILLLSLVFLLTSGGSSFSTIVALALFVAFSLLAAYILFLLITDPDEEQSNYRERASYNDIDVRVWALGLSIVTSIGLAMLMVGNL